MLLYIFLFIVVFLFLLPTILLSVIRSIISIFGFNFNGNRKRKSNTRKNNTSFTGSGVNDVGGKKQNRKKIFDKNDGEYVDFEEIK